MDHSNQSLHGLPILNCDGVSSNAKRKDFNSICGNNDRNRTQILKNGMNLKINEPQKKKADVKNSKTKSRRKPASHKNLKKTLSVCSNYVKRLTQPRSTANSSRNQKKIKPSCHTNQIKVLFSSKARKLKNNRSNINQDLIKDIYNFNAMNYENAEDMCNTSTAKLIKRQNILLCEVPNRKKQRIRQQYTLNTTNRGNNLCKSSPKSSQSRDCYDIQEQYKVVQFPDYNQTDTELEAINMGRNDDLYNFQFNCENGFDSQKDKQVDQSKPNVSTAQRGGGDACTVSIQCLDPKEARTKHEKSNNDGFECFLDPLNIHKNAQFLAKIALQYLIFGLALIAWSPCIITLYFFWFVTYPLRPSYTSTSATRNSRSKRKSQEEVYGRGSKHVTDISMQTCRKNTWSFLLEGVSWAYQPIAVSFGAFKSLLNKNTNNLCNHQSSTNEKCARKDRVVASDPRKKYTLYYSRSKGWVMKSTKRKKEVPKVTYESHCPNQINDRKPIAVTCRYPQCSCRLHAGKYTFENNNRICFQDHSRSRHNHLCADTSGLPVHVKLLNPMFNNNVSSKRYIDKPVNKKTKSIVQRCKRERQCERVRYPENRYKKRSRCKPKPRIKLKNRIWRYCNEIKCSIKSLIDEVETEVFGDNFCKGIYIHTLRKKPWYYVFKKCPSFYPVFLGICRFYENTCHFFLLFFSACIWCPLLAFFYFCYEIFCRSL